VQLFEHIFIVEVILVQLVLGTLQFTKGCVELTWNVQDEIEN
jgi:hypothetical protein